MLLIMRLEKISESFALFHLLTIKIFLNLIYTVKYPLYFLWVFSKHTLFWLTFMKHVCDSDNCKEVCNVSDPVLKEEI